MYKKLNIKKMGSLPIIDIKKVMLLYNKNNNNNNNNNNINNIKQYIIFRKSLKYH